MLTAAPLLPAPAAATAPAPAAPPRYGFAGAMMGADLEAWRRSQPMADCAATPGRPNLVVCRIADQLLGAAYAARDLTYLFLDGRLAQIRFRTSIDGFAYAVAKLKHDFGEPTSIRRDVIRLSRETAQHVAWDWRNGRSTIELSDPAPPGGQLAVRITLDAAASSLAAAAASRLSQGSPGGD